MDLEEALAVLDEYTENLTESDPVRQAITTMTHELDQRQRFITFVVASAGGEVTVHRKMMQRSDLTLAREEGLDGRVTFYTSDRA